jgi:hypothetical protein
MEKIENKNPNLSKKESGIFIISTQKRDVANSFSYVED